MRRIVMVSWLLLLLQVVVPSGNVYAADAIGADDVLKITVYGYDDLTTETRVSPDGRINFPLVGEVIAKGKTVMQLEEAIAVKLVQGGFIHNAHVNVVVLDNVSQYVSVLGYVGKPGRYPLNSNSTLVDVLASAGGILVATAETGSNVVLVTRNIDGYPQKFAINILDNLELEGAAPAFKVQPGDDIYVPKSAMFYVFGEVQRPGAYRLEADTNVMKAVSIAGGITLRGSENRISIKRKNTEGKLEENEAELVTDVQKGDVIYIGERWF